MQGVFVDFLRNHDEGELDHLGAERAEFCGQFRRLFPRTGDGNSSTEENGRRAHEISLNSRRTRAAVAPSSTKSSASRGTIAMPTFSWKRCNMSGDTWAA